MPETFCIWSTTSECPCRSSESVIPLAATYSAIYLSCTPDSSPQSSSSTPSYKPIPRPPRDLIQLKPRLSDEIFGPRNPKPKYHFVSPSSTNPGTKESWIAGASTESEKHQLFCFHGRKALLWQRPNTKSAISFCGRPGRRFRRMGRLWWIQSWYLIWIGRQNLIILFIDLNQQIP